MFADKTNASKFSTSLNFCGVGRSFHFVNIPIILIKPKASFECIFVTEAFFITEFSVYGVGSCLKCANL